MKKTNDTQQDANALRVLEGIADLKQATKEAGEKSSIPSYIVEGMREIGRGIGTLLIDEMQVAFPVATTIHLLHDPLAHAHAHASIRHCTLFTRIIPRA